MQLPEGTHRITDTLKERLSTSHSDAAILGAALERDGMPELPLHEAHHIVPSKGGGADGERARRILERCAIGLNESDNGIWLPRTSHSSRAGGVVVRSDAATSHDNVHTEVYFREVADRLTIAEQQGGEDRVRAELNLIRRQLHEGTFAH
ncbi:hypothetical protein ABI59_17765 [Acidobacteria bacterium Mor1]|nr:hypothetical protein ABI59_17765 [Acidobacteria bacterium Mor1]